MASEMGSLASLIGDLCYATASEMAFGDRMEQAQADQQRAKQHEFELQHAGGKMHREVGKGFAQGITKAGSHKLNENMKKDTRQMDLNSGTAMKKRPLPDAPKYEKSGSEKGFEY